MKRILSVVVIILCILSTAAFAEGYPRISLLRTGNTAPDLNHPYTKYVMEQTGVEPEVRQLTGDYAEGLQLIFASGVNVPDVFRPLTTGIDATLVEQGAALALDDLLPEYAPLMWEQIPDDVWALVRADNKDGKIYYIPQVYIDYAERGWIIRQDWLDNLELEIPTTKDELVAVLRAFRDGDPNQNGITDEIPACGSYSTQGPFGLNGFFAMYGIPTFQEAPLWDLYEGRLTYYGVTPNMRDALIFLSELYAEGLIDPEFFLNTGNDFGAKMSDDRVGMTYHVLHQSELAFFANLYQKNPNARLTSMAPPKVEGYDGFMTRLQIANRDWCIPLANEKNAANVLKYFDWWQSEEGLNFVAYGIPGETWDMVDGEIAYYPEKDTADLFDKRYLGLKGLQANFGNWFTDNILAIKGNGLGEMLIDMEKITMEASRTIAGDGIPLSIYEGYPDHKNHLLWRECTVNIITGEWPIEKFDEMVAQWYATGGDVIEERANEWYDYYQSLLLK